MQLLAKYTNSFSIKLMAKYTSKFIFTTVGKVYQGRQGRREREQAREGDRDKGRETGQDRWSTDNIRNITMCQWQLRNGGRRTSRERVKKTQCV